MASPTTTALGYAHGDNAGAIMMMASVTSSMLGQPSASPSPTNILDSPDLDAENCRLLGPFALFVQALMGIIVMSSLLLKRQRERPKRPWKIWSLDVTKQALGQLFVHTLNVLLSSLVARQGRNNPCTLYFLNIGIDTTLGIFFIYITLRYMTYLFTDILHWPGFVSGAYGNIPDPEGGSGRPRLSYWLRQLCMYFFALLLMKLGVLGLFALFPWLFDLGRWLLGWLGDNVNAQVVFVMMVFPLVMNVVQFWLIDSLLRHNPHSGGHAKEGGEDDDGDEEEGGPGNDSERCGALSAFPGGSGRRRQLAGGQAGVHYREAEGRLDESSAHLVGEASDDESDEEDHHHQHRHTGGAGGAQHAYPPPTAPGQGPPSRPVSRTSARTGTGSENAKGQRKGSGYGSMLGSPPLGPSAPPPPSGSASAPASASGSGSNSRSRSPISPNAADSAAPAGGAGAPPFRLSGLDELRPAAARALSDGGGSDPASEHEEANGGEGDEGAWNDGGKHEATGQPTTTTTRARARSKAGQRRAGGGSADSVGLRAVANASGEP